METGLVQRVVEEEFAGLELALECQLCKEGIKSAMMLPCGHSFCSLCIRRTLQALHCCPVCREGCSENDLRKNIVLQQLADFCNLLPARLRARLSHPTGDKSAAADIAQRQNQQVGGNERISAKHIAGKWNYNLMSDKDIRNLCRQNGLPEKGDKKSLERLHREFVMRFNAHVDSGAPRSESEIRTQVAREVKTEYNNANLNRTRAGAVNIFERAAGRFNKGAALSGGMGNGSGKGPASEDDLFDQLIRQVKERQRQKEGQVGACGGLGGRRECGDSGADAARVLGMKEAQEGGGSVAGKKGSAIRASAPRLLHHGTRSLDGWAGAGGRETGREGCAEDDDAVEDCVQARRYFEHQPEGNAAQEAPREASERLESIHVGSANGGELVPEPWVAVMSGLSLSLPPSLPLPLPPSLS